MRHIVIPVQKRTSEMQKSPMAPEYSQSLEKRNLVAFLPSVSTSEMLRQQWPRRPGDQYALVVKTPETSKILGISVQAVYRVVRSGKLVPIKKGTAGKGMLFTFDSVANWLLR